MTETSNSTPWRELDYITRASYNALEKQEHRLMMLSTLFGSIDADSTPLAFTDCKAISELLFEAGDTITTFLSNAGFSQEWKAQEGKESET